MKFKYIGFFIALLCTAVSFGQIKVKGTVKDKGNVPIPGVNVMVKGTSTSAATDFDGNYVLNVPNKNAQIEFTFVGFTTKLETIGDRTEINVILEESSQTLDEIVVVGYAAVKKSDVTSSISSIKGKELQTMTVGNVTESLQGKVAVVYLQVTDCKLTHTRKLLVWMTKTCSV